MSVVIPTFTLHGWVTNPAQHADFLLADYLATMHSQTNTVSPVYSFAYDLAQAEGDKVAIIQNVSNSLQRLYRQHFDDAQVDVALADSQRIPGTTDINISILIKSGDTHFSLDGALRSQDSVTYQFVSTTN